MCFVHYFSIIRGVLVVYFLRFCCLFDGGCHRNYRAKHDSAWCLQDGKADLYAIKCSAAAGVSVEECS